jgi:hypothetical protein
MIHTDWKAEEFGPDWKADNSHTYTSMQHDSALGAATLVVFLQKEE